MLVRLGFGAPVDPEDLEEFKQLARSAGAQPVATVTGRRERPDPNFFVGSGKADELRDAAAATEADLILVDHALSPSQERNLEEHTGRRVLDRNGLILDIFAQRARSFEGKLEVELAQLKHLASRLVRGWTHLERQKGGIGMRGPGETQLETDRRLLNQRVRVLTQAPASASSSSARPAGACAREIPVPSVALVGYTNAGKSTLFSALTGAQAYVADQLFATLDPTVRRIRLPGGTPVVVADTVGFIRELPHELVAAFHSTLTEAREATLLLHVVDASDRAPRGAHGAGRRGARARSAPATSRRSVVYNKIDRLELAAAHRARCGRPRHARCGFRPHRRPGFRCCARPSPSGWRARRGARGCGCRRAAGRCARGCTPRTWCARSSLARTARSSLWWSCRRSSCWRSPRTAGVRILEVQPPTDSPCAPAEGFLQSAPFPARPSCAEACGNRARATPEVSYGLESTRRSAVNKVLGVGAPAAAHAWMSA